MSQEVVPPERTGKKATVMVQIEVMVEVADSDSFSDMVAQAREQLKIRVFPAKVFHPYRMHVHNVHRGYTVEQLRYGTVVEPSKAWDK